MPVVALDQRERPADEVGEGVGPGALDDAAAYLAAVDLHDRRRARHGLVGDHRAVRHRHLEPSRRSQLAIARTRLVSRLPL